MELYFISEKNIFSKAKLKKLSKVCKVIFLFNNNDKNYEALIKSNAEKVIIYDPDFAGWSIPDKIVNDISNLKAIFLGTTDKSYISEDICQKKNIQIVNIPKYAANTVAEYVIFYMFACAKKLPLQIKNNNKQDFTEEFKQIELIDRKVGIIGLGNIGQKIAGICFGMGMNVCYWDRSIKQVSYDFVTLEEIFNSCDVVFLTLQVNSDTKKMITDDLLKSMKPNCIFISCTGKQLFNYELVEKMIAEDKIFGYALEDPNISIEQHKGNVMVTSEYGWFTKEASKRRYDFWFDNVANFICNEQGLSKDQLLGRGKEMKIVEPIYCVIRKAKMADIPAIVNLYKSQGWLGDHNSVEKIKENYKTQIDDDRYFLLVAEYKGKVLGTVQANINNAAAFDCKDFMVLDYLIIDKQYRRRKVGTQLVSKLLEICKARNLESVWLDSSQGRIIAHKFYSYLHFDDPVKGFRKTF